MDAFPLLLATMATVPPDSAASCGRSNAISDICCGAAEHTVMADFQHFVYCRISGARSPAACPPHYTYQPITQECTSPIASPTGQRTGSQTGVHEFTEDVTTLSACAADDPCRGDEAVRDLCCVDEIFHMQPGTTLSVACTMQPALATPTEAHCPRGWYFARWGGGKCLRSSSWPGGPKGVTMMQTCASVPPAPPTPPSAPSPTPSPPSDRFCVASACREHLPSMADSDCCGAINATFCASGYNHSKVLSIASGGSWTPPRRGGFHQACPSWYGGNTCCTPVRATPPEAMDVYMCLW